MTQQQKIILLARMVEEDPTDTTVAGLLEIYLQIAGDKILNRMYPYETDYTDFEVPVRYEMIQLNVACYLFNKIGAEGEIQHIENGIHRNYGSSDVPDSLLKDVTPYCKAIR